MLKLGFVSLALLFAQQAFSQHRVDPSNSYHRVIAIVPLVGTGTWADPKRPMYAPPPSLMGREKSGILAYYYEPTDDGKSVVAVFVGVQRTALASVLTAVGPNVTVFDSVQQSQTQVEQSIKAVKKNFDWARFAVRVQ